MMKHSIKIPIILLMLFLLTITTVSAFPTVSWETYDDFTDLGTLTTLWDEDWVLTLYSTGWKATNGDSSDGYLQSKVNTSYILDGFYWDTSYGDGDNTAKTYICLGDGAITNFAPYNGVCIKFGKYKYYEYNQAMYFQEYTDGVVTTSTYFHGTGSYLTHQNFKMMINGTTLYATVDSDDVGFDLSWTTSYTPTTSTYALISTSDDSADHVFWESSYISSPPPATFNITNTDATNINQFNVTLESDWTYEDASWVDAYWVVDTTEKSHTNYTSATSHDEVITGLDWETTYDYKLCGDSDLGSVCSDVKNFTTANRVAPYINIYTEFDVNQTYAGVGGTFFFEDFENITAYVVLDGVNQTQTEYASGTSQYHSETFSGLDHNTTYTFDFCIEYENGVICGGEDTFTTTDYTAPSINVISAFDITNHETTLGTTVLYNDYSSMIMTWYLDGELVDSEEVEQDDEFDTSEYYTYNLTELDYFTFYEYELVVSYESFDYSLQNVTTCDDPMTQLYDCDGTKVSLWDGSTVDATRCLEMALNFESYIYNPTAYENDFPDGLNPTCVEVDNGYCSVWNGTKVSGGDGSSFASNCSTTEETTGTSSTINESDSFTTLDAYIPYITISTAYDIGGDIATLSGTHYSYDYPSTTPFFRLDGVDLLPKTNITKDYSTPNTLTYDLTSLETNTTYNYSFCVGYGLGWSLLVCDSTKEFTTGFIPEVSFGIPNPINKENITLHWTVDWLGATNVTYNFKGSVTDVPAVDGVEKDYVWTGLDVETDYSYWLEINYTTLGNSYILNTPNQNVTTAYDNEFDNVWDTLLQGSSFAKILLGFVVLFGIIFLGVGVFGKYNLQISMVAILIFGIIGSVLATLMKLFSIGILLIIIIGSVIIMVLKNMLIGGNE